jgi:carboxypeptidase Q
MKLLSTSLLLLNFGSLYSTLIPHHLNEIVPKLVESTLSSSIIWDRLAEMTDTFGHRQVGSKGLEHVKLFIYNIFNHH